MRLPQWLLHSLLGSSIVGTLVMLIGAGWWWVKWPERTSNEFVWLVNQNKYGRANELLTPNPEWVFLADSESFLNATGGATHGWKIPLFSFWRSEFTKLGVVIEPRTSSDFVLARQRFASAHSSWHFTAERGMIQFHGDVRTILDPETKSIAVLGEIADGYEAILSSELLRPELPTNALHSTLDH